MDYSARYHCWKLNNLEYPPEQNISSIATVFSKSTIYTGVSGAFGEILTHFHKRKSQFLFERIAINTPISSACSHFFARGRRSNV